MHTRTRFPFAALLALALALLPACATAGGGTTDEPTADAPARVVVNNNLVVPTSLTISIVPETGVRRLLGNVPPGGRATLPYNDPGIAGRFRLLARSTAGRDLLSDPFTFNGRGTITWDLQSNIIRVTD
jgi:hypothetical protein